jgi:hypothetical protein
MDNKNLRGLSEAYSEVYSDNLEQLDEDDPRFTRPRNAGVPWKGKDIFGRSISNPVSNFSHKGGDYRGAELQLSRNAAISQIGTPRQGSSGGSSYRPISKPTPTSTPRVADSGRPTPSSAPRPTPTSSSRPATPAPRPTAATPSVASSPRPTAALAPRPAAPSSLSTGGRRSNSELEGKTFATRATSGGTKYEVRTPTSAELAAARKAGGEKGVQAAVAINNQRKIPTSRTPIPEMNSYDFGKPDRITQDVASLYHSIYEAKKKVDQDKDGDNDFADVEIARMVAGGMPLKDAIAAVRNKSYNKKAELGEAAVRVPKKVRGAKDAKAYMAGRSDAGKRISGDEDTGPRYYTLGRSRGATPDSPTEPGQRPQHTPRATKSELEYARYVRNSSKKNPNLFGEPKGLPEEFEFWVNELLDEGYDLSEYTVDEMYEIFEETERKLRPASERTKTAKTRAQITSQRAKERAAEKKAEALERAAQKVINQTQGRSGRVSENPMGSEAPAAKEAAPNRDDVTTQIEPGEAGSKKHQRAHRALKAAQSNEDFNLWVNELLDEGHDLSDYTWDELYENYQELDEVSRVVSWDTGKNRKGISPSHASAHRQATLQTSSNPADRIRATQIGNIRGNMRAAIEATPTAKLQSAGPIASERFKKAAIRQRGGSPDSSPIRTKPGLKAANRAAQARRTNKEEYNAYDLVIGHLLDEGFADDCDSANMMIERMSDEWLNEILESKN